MRAYYNDHDKNVCAWLEQLIKNGDITKGDVDDRSITEVKPSDIAGYDRVHLFAGIGTWDYALDQREYLKGVQERRGKPARDQLEKKMLDVMNERTERKKVG